VNIKVRKLKNKAPLPAILGKKDSILGKGVKRKKSLGGATTEQKFSRRTERDKKKTKDYIRGVKS